VGNAGQFQKGNPGGPGRQPQRLSQPVIFNLKQAARKHCEEALQVIAACLKDKDPKVRLLAATIMLERGYGKPELKADVTATHRFAVVPDTMPKDEWLSRHGQPVGSAPYTPPRSYDPNSKTLDLEAEKPDPDSKPN
jgi:hypothetical protein